MYNFNSGSKSLTQSSSVVTIQGRNAWPSVSYLSVMLQYTGVYACSAVRDPLGTNFSFLQIFFFSKFEMVMFPGILVACDIVSYGVQWTSKSKAITSFTLCLSVDAFSIPWVVVYADMSNMKTSSPMWNYYYGLLSAHRNFMQSAVNFCKFFLTWSCSFDVWSVLINCHSTCGPVNEISDTHKFTLAHIREVTDTRAASSSHQQ